MDRHTASTGHSGSAAGDGARGPSHAEIRRAIKLPLAKAVGIAWRSIRVRLGRSLLVTSGIVLALAFLTYILASDALMRSVADEGPQRLLETLQRKGVLAALDDAEARAQTWWLVGLALMVSFVGILNAMLMSVTERYGEIGTMKCLGALDSLIIELFLLETLFQGLLGTAAGVAIGLALAFVEGGALYGEAAWAYAPWGGLARLVGVAVVVGVGLTLASALYPAWRAARMLPIDALRTEV